jgi:glycosyltransferase involved in cell wall biosynthesis
VPSEWRNTGSSSGLEALVRSTPVITNDEFGMYEDLPQGQRVLAYPTGSVEVLADRIRLLVRNPSILQELSTAPFHRTFGDHVAPIREVYLEARRAIG